MAGRQTSHTIYRYFNKNLTVRNNKEATQMQKETPDYRKFFLERINNEEKYGLARIYKSQYPGLGKTYQI